MLLALAPPLFLLNREGLLNEETTTVMVLSTKHLAVTACEACHVLYVYMFTFGVACTVHKEYMYITLHMYMYMNMYTYMYIESHVYKC